MAAPERSHAWAHNELRGIVVSLRTTPAFVVCMRPGVPDGPECLRPDRKGTESREQVSLRGLGQALERNVAQRLDRRAHLP